MSLEFLIVGTPRSGTTLVQRLACELPGVAVPPETHFFSLFLPRLLADRSFPLDESEVDDEVERFKSLKTSRGLELSTAALKAHLDLPCASPLDLFAALVKALSPGASCYGEKTPNHLLWWRPLSAALPHLRFIAVVRDPRSVVASYRATWGTEHYLVTAERWSADQRAVLDMLEALGDERALLLRYEDVVADPDRIPSQLASFLGVADGRARRHPSVLHLPWETWKRRALEPVEPTRVEAWNEALSDAEAYRVASVCRDTMTAFGYPALGKRFVGDDLYQRGRFRLRRAAKARRIARTRLDRCKSVT